MYAYAPLLAKRGAWGKKNFLYGNCPKKAEAQTTGEQNKSKYALVMKDSENIVKNLWYVENGLFCLFRIEFWVDKRYNIM